MTRIDQALAILKKEQKKNSVHPTNKEVDVSFIDAFNFLFGSDSELLCFKDKERQLAFKRVFLTSVSHRGKAKNVRDGLIDSLYIEDWVLLDEETFQTKKAREITVLEDTIMATMIYMLGGFTFPEDEFREAPLKHMKVDVEEIIREPRKSFLLLNINPAYILLFLIWKIETMTQASGRENQLMSRYKENAEKALLILRQRKGYDDQGIKLIDGR